jgi:hypothetical protein
VASHLFQLGFAGSQQREPIINFDGRAVFGLMASPPTSTEQIPGIFPVLGRVSLPDRSIFERCEPF